MNASWLLAASLLLAHGCKSNEPAAKPGKAPGEKSVTRSDAIDKEIIRLVKDSQTEGFTHHDLEGYMAIWSDDATLIGGRGPTPGPMDQVHTRAQIEANKSLLFSGPPTGVSLTVSNAKVDWKGEEAILSWQAKMEQPGFVETVNEHYKLRKTGKGWRVYENRYWLVESGPTDAVVKFDADYWAAKDKAVSAAQSEGDKQGEVMALAEAGLRSEAHKLSSQLIVGSEDPEQWTQHLYLAVGAGEIEDAKASACKVKALKPEAVLPIWAGSLRCEAP